VPAATYFAGVTAFEAQAHFGTLCSFGFITVYILTCLAAPAYLASIGKLSRKAIAYSAGGIGFMLLPLVGTTGIPGSDLLPTPDTAGLSLMAIFATFMGLGFAWLLVQRGRRPAVVQRMQLAVATLDAERAQLGKQTRSRSSHAPSPDDDDYPPALAG